MAILAALHWLGLHKLRDKSLVTCAWVATAGDIGARGWGVTTKSTDQKIQQSVWHQDGAMIYTAALTSNTTNKVFIVHNPIPIHVCIPKQPQHVLFTHNDGMNTVDILHCMHKFRGVYPSIAVCINSLKGIWHCMQNGIETIIPRLQVDIAIMLYTIRVPTIHKQRNLLPVKTCWWIQMQNDWSGGRIEIRMQKMNSLQAWLSVCRERRWESMMMFLLIAEVISHRIPGDPSGLSGSGWVRCLKIGFRALCLMEQPLSCSVKFS